MKHISQSTHTPEKPVVNKVTEVKATLINGGKVHRVRDDVARCGVSKSRKHVEWQMEFGNVTCRRCGKMEKAEMIQRILPGLDCPRS